jgi:hypothetical protein
MPQPAKVLDRWAQADAPRIMQTPRFKAPLNEREAMIDTSTSERLLVCTEGSMGPFIELPLSQLDQVKQLLDDHGIYYWVAEDVVSWDDGPEIAELNLGRKGDAQAVQALLDSVD